MEEKMGKKVVDMATYRQQTRALRTDEDCTRWLSPQTKQALAELLSDTENAPYVKKSTTKRPARTAQTIQGDNNVQLAGQRISSQSIIGNGNTQIAAESITLICRPQMDNGGTG